MQIIIYFVYGQKCAHFFLILFFILLTACGQIDIPKDVSAISASLPKEIDYNLHFKKILSDKCFACHGPDMKKQKADLRLDIASFAYNKKTESGLKAIQPKSIAKSELVHRILSNDPEYKMPSASSHLELTAYEKAVLIKWIEQGAVYKEHWAFVPPVKSDPPIVKNSEWAKNDIDLFILNSIEKEGLAPAKKAEKEKLIRRLSFEIRGFAPPWMGSSWGVGIRYEEGNKTN